MIRRSYDLTPLEPRRGHGDGDVTPSGTALRLPFRRPFDWAGMLEFLGDRAIPGVEEVVGETYRRAIRIGGRPGLVEVRRSPKRDLLHAHLHLPQRVPLMPLVLRLRHLFDLEADSEIIDRHLSRDPRLRPIVRRHPGTRVPGAWDPFELVVRAIVGQQVSVRAATTLAGRLAEKHGEPTRESLPDSSIQRLFPTPQALAEADLSGVGLTARRAQAICGLARAVADGDLVLDGSGDPETARERLVALPGIGPWTAQYVTMRISRDPNVLLSGDLGVRRALQTRDGLPSPGQVERLAEPWSPWRAYAVVYLWRGSAGRR